jgi:HSP20 family molecular chaperone IbpA
MDTSVWDEIATMEERLNELLHEELGPHAHLARPVLPLFLRRPFVPAMDVYRRRGDLIVRLELPDIDPATDVRITVEGCDLVIAGERPRCHDVADEAYYRLEARYGAFRRRFPLPGWVDQGAITSTYEDGVLEILVPRASREVHT